MNDRLIELETKIAYQEHTIDILNEVVTKQQDQIDRLEARIEAMAEQLRNLSDNISQSPVPDPPPPHY